MSTKVKFRDRSGQMTFEDHFIRPLQPKKDLTEPLLWFQNLRIRKRLGDGDGEANCLRNYTFRQGLNILWAEPEPLEDDTEIYEDGIAGHATGKTLFCRTLRFILGESHYGTDKLKLNLQSRYSELWALATIRLGGRTWVVGRPLCGVGGSFAKVDANVADVGNTTPAQGGFDEFRQELDEVCGGVVAGLYPETPWKHLLPWIARDQEARFAGITDWRDARCNSDNPRWWGQLEQNLMLRATLGLLSPKEVELKKQASQLQEDNKTAHSELPQQQARTDTYRRTAQNLLKTLPRVNIDFADLVAAELKIKEQRTIREESLEILCSVPEADVVQTARSHLLDAERKKSSIAARKKTLEEQIPEEAKRLDDGLNRVERIRTKGIRDPRRINDNFCPNSHQHAIDRKCVNPPPGMNSVTMVELKELEDASAAEAAALESKRTQLGRLTSELDQLEADIATKQKELQKALKQAPVPLLQVQGEITTLRVLEGILKEALSASKAEERSSSSVKTRSEELERMRNKMELLRLDAAEGLRPLSDIFCDVVQGVLGRKITGKIDLTDRLELSVHQESELGGAAIESIKTVAFDLAAVIGSMEGRGHHPRFLIHDGPRESDLARGIYERLFGYAETLESGFREDTIPFQYIITTTTPPPKHMREGSKWLIGDVLSSAEPSKRFLRAEF
jgi:hypothetical protein